MPGKSINRRKIPAQQTNKDSFVENKDILKSPKLNYSIEQNKKHLFLFVFLLIVVTFGVFSPTFKNTYTNWDDTKYVGENPLIKPFDTHTIKEMFASETLYKRYWMGNYHPLTMLTLNINYALAKKDAEGNARAFGFQLVNILLHILNTLLVFFIILKLLKNTNAAFFAALLFGVHTLHVESVTWIAERKDVLYTFFYLSSLYLYIIYAQHLKIKYYLFAFFLFLLSLLSKGQATSLAVTIILVDYFYGRKLLSRRLIIEKIPFLILAFIFGLIAIEAQKQGNALQVINSTPFLNRIGIAGFGFTMYLLKLILPVGLSAVYPYPDIIHQTIPAYFWLGLITVAIVVYIWIKSYKKDRVLFFGIGFFIINIFLLLQLLPVGSAIYADRYVYIPSIGFFLIFAYLLTKFTGKKIKSAFVIVGIYAVLLSGLTLNRIKIWHNSRTLWEDVTHKQPKSVVAWNNLGSEYNRMSNKYFKQNNFEKYKFYKQKSLKCFDNAIERKPDYSSAFYNRGFAEFDLGEKMNDTSLVFDALKDFNRSIAIDLTFVNSYQQRAAVFDWLKEYKKALTDYNYALTLSPNNAEIYVNRGITKGKTGDFEAALKDFDKAILLNPKMANAYSNRGLDYAFMKKYNYALADYNKSIELKPQANTYFNRAMTYFNLKKYQQAINDFQNAIDMNYRLAAVFYYKAICEKEVKKNQQACLDMKTAAEKKYPLAIALVDKFCK